MQKKIPVKTLYLLLVISIGLIGLGVGSTFAMFTATAEIDNPISLTYGLDYGYDVIETVEATVSANSDRTITLNITNSTSSNLNYTCFYITSNNRIELGTDLSHNTIGTINAGATIPLNVTIRNNTDSEETIILGVLSNKESITLSEEMRVIPNKELSSGPAEILSAAKTISGLFSKTGTVTNNGVTYDVDTNNNMIKDHAGNIRYYGNEPNNYATLSGDSSLYRIIGVFKDVTLEDGTTKDLVKIIQSEPLEDVMIWDEFDINWEYTQLQSYLNNDYIDYLPSEYYAESVVWNLGFAEEPLTIIEYPNLIYNYERAIFDYEITPITWTGKIGIPYPSDYAFSANFEYCSNNLVNYSSSECRDENWLYSDYIFQAYWLMYYTTNNYVFYVDMDGRVDMIPFYASTCKVLPTFYLSKTGFIASGTGAGDDPYIIYEQ